MLESTRRIIWLAVGVSLWIGALVFTWTGIRHTEQLLDASGIRTHPQVRSLYESPSNITESEHYTGAQIICFVQDSANDSIGLELEGRVYPNRSDELKASLIQQIQLDGVYGVSYSWGASGKVVHIAFHKMN
ncbi:hypothetical protein [Paenibacillus sp. J22TS3]|uniref:hypothetical protein n=1 Tax=Paenibacillus sp. J22TS3 TaxID=2807192 RepID=UPI001BCDEA4D|nr:hypothetical protein [Paenibacillus sp. J22TS3]